MMERATYAEEESQEIPVEYKEMWEYLEIESAKWLQAPSRTEAGGSPKGGGG